MKGNPLTNVLSFPPEALEAIEVLDFDGKGWREIHEAIIQSGMDNKARRQTACGLFSCALSVFSAMHSSHFA